MIIYFKALFTSLVLLFITVANILGQATETRGNMLRISFDSQEINLSDTVGSWFYQSGSEYNSSGIYSGVFTYNNNQYFLFRSHNESPIWYSSSLSLRSTALESDIGLYGSANAIDYIGPYLFSNLVIIPISSGIWFLNGETSTLFLDNNEDLITKDFMKVKVNHIPGMIDQNYLVLTGTEQEIYDEIYTYSLCNLDNSPNVDSLQRIVVNKEDSSRGIVLLKLRQINDSLFFASANDNEDTEYNIAWKNFRIAKLEDTTLTILNNEFENENLTHWVTFGNKILGLRDSTLISQTLNPGSLQFESIDTLAENVYINDYSLSFNKKFNAFTRNDSLFVFSLENESLINSWSLEGIDKRYSPMVDSPYVYIRQVTTIVGVDKEKKLPKEIALHQNYPNPFNPTTKIKFAVPNVGTSRDLPLQTKLTVYDILGKEVKTLLNKLMQPGIHEIEFDGSNLSSGIYFYVLETGCKRLSKKMLLIK